MGIIEHRQGRKHSVQMFSSFPGTIPRTATTNRGRERSFRPTVDCGGAVSNVSGGEPLFQVAEPLFQVRDPFLELGKAVHVGL